MKDLSRNKTTSFFCIQIHCTVIMLEVIILSVEFESNSTQKNCAYEIFHPTGGLLSFFATFLQRKSMNLKSMWEIKIFRFLRQLRHFQFNLTYLVVCKKVRKKSKIHSFANKKLESRKRIQYLQCQVSLTHRNFNITNQIEILVHSDVQLKIF